MILLLILLIVTRKLPKFKISFHPFERIFLPGRIFETFLNFPDPNPKL